METAHQGQAGRAGEHPGSATEPRINADQLLVTVRTFYADIAQWAADDPGRWAAWVAPNPVKETAVALRKTKTQRKSRMDQRTRERLPVMPALLAHVRAQRTPMTRAGLKGPLRSVRDFARKEWPPSGAVWLMS